MQHTSKPNYKPLQTTGFACPFCQASVYPSRRLSYPATAEGRFAPVYRCTCGKMVGEPLNMVQINKQPV